MTYDDLLRDYSGYMNRFYGPDYLYNMKKKAQKHLEEEMAGYGYHPTENNLAGSGVGWENEAGDWRPGSPRGMANDSYHTDMDEVYNKVQGIGKDWYISRKNKGMLKDLEYPAGTFLNGNLDERIPEKLFNDWYDATSGKLESDEQEKLKQQNISKGVQEGTHAW